MLGAQMQTSVSDAIAPVDVAVHCPSCKIGLMVRQRFLTLPEPELVDSS